MEPWEKPGYRYETCVRCKKRWNVSTNIVIRAGGYICPTCRRIIEIKEVKHNDTVNGREDSEALHNAGSGEDPD